MYPFHRATVEWVSAGRKPALDIGGVHESHITCLPWDLDGFFELNNGRTLTLYDIPRFGFFRRTGIIRAAREQRWGLTVAGSSVRYRRRVRAFQRLDATTMLVGRDDRFAYMHQSLWHKGEATSSLLLRLAVTKSGKLVPTEEIGKAMGQTDWNPPLPDWVTAWAEAESQRPWPPMAPPTTQGP